MNNGQRQVVAEKVSSTVRVLELLGFDYAVLPPKNKRKEGNRSPRVIHVSRGGSELLRVYNSVRGSTWANLADGTPIPEVKSIENLYNYLEKQRSATS